MFIWHFSDRDCPRTAFNDGIRIAMRIAIRDNVTRISIRVNPRDRLRFGEDVEIAALNINLIPSQYPHIRKMRNKTYGIKC